MFNCPRLSFFFYFSAHFQTKNPPDAAKIANAFMKAIILTVFVSVYQFWETIKIWISTTQNSSKLRPGHQATKPEHEETRIPRAPEKILYNLQVN